MVDREVFLDPDWVLQFILIVIILFLGLLFFTDNRLPNSIGTNQGEQDPPSDHLDKSFQQGKQPGDQTFTPGLVRACSLCGKLCNITTKCSCCREVIYCSQVCQSIHWRLWHRYECLEIELRVTQGRSTDANGTSKHFHDHVNESSSYTSHEDEEDSDIEERREEPIHEFNGPTRMLGALYNYNGCAVCGNPITRKFSRCKSFICWRSSKCQNQDWKFGHELQGNVEKVNPDKKVNSRQGRSAHPDVRMLQTRYEEKDGTHSSVPLSMGPFSEGTTNSKPLIGSSQEITEKVEEEIAQRVRCLEEELAKSRNENRLQQSKRGESDMRTKFAADRLHNYMIDSKNELLILKHEKELISNAEKQARDMVQNLSERLHRLQACMNAIQIAEEARVAEKRKQEEYIQTLQNECAKAKRELEEASLSVRTLTMEREEANQTVINALNAAATADSRAADAEEKLCDLKRIVIPADEVQTEGLSRQFAFSNEHACAICLTNEKDMAFECGHMTCRDCGLKISRCPICRKKISSRVRLFPG